MALPKMILIDRIQSLNWTDQFSKTKLSWTNSDRTVGFWAVFSSMIYSAWAHHKDWPIWTLVFTCSACFKIFGTRKPNWPFSILSICIFCMSYAQKSLGFWIFYHQTQMNATRIQLSITRLKQNEPSNRNWHMLMGNQPMNLDTTTSFSITYNGKKHYLS